MLAAKVLRYRYPVGPPGGMHIVDVREVADVLAAVMEPGRGPRSYLAAGHYATMPAIIAALANLTGRRLRFMTFLAWFMAAFGRAAARCDGSKTRDELLLEPRPLAETLTDTIRWLARAGHLTARQAGRLA